MDPEDRGRRTNVPFCDTDEAAPPPAAPPIAPPTPEAAEAAPLGGSGTATALPCFFHDCRKVELTLA